MWVPTIKATSVTQDTAVDSLSAATTTMNSGVSPACESLGIPGSWLLPRLIDGGLVSPFLILLGAVLASRICVWVPEVVPLERRSALMPSGHCGLKTGEYGLSLVKGLWSSGLLQKLLPGVLSDALSSVCRLVTTI